MDRTEKILGMLTLLELNDDQFCYEMSSLGNKINNFLDDQSRLISAQWLSVMYKSLTEENESETVEIITNKPFKVEVFETVGNDTDETCEINTNDFIDESSLGLNNRGFALVDELVAV